MDLRRSDVIHMSAVKGAVQIKGRGSDIELEDVGGEVSIDGAYTGTIELRKLAKPVHFTGTQTDFNIESVPGQVSMTLGDFTGFEALLGPTHLTGRSRDVQISDFTGPLDVTLERGDLNLRPGTAAGAHPGSFAVGRHSPVATGGGAVYAECVNGQRRYFQSLRRRTHARNQRPAAELCGEPSAAVRRSNSKRSAAILRCRRLLSQARMRRCEKLDQ